MQSTSKSTLSSGRLLKLSLFAGVTYGSLASGASVGKAMGLKVFAGSLAATLPGVIDGHLAVSFGYGLAMIWMGGVFLPLCKGSPSALLAIAYVLYGVKVVLFQGARDARPDYVAKVARSRPCGLCLRCVVCHAHTHTQDPGAWSNSGPGPGRFLARATCACILWHARRPLVRAGLP